MPGMNAFAKVPVRLTVDEFLLWADGVPGRWELVDGEPREVPPPVRTHSAVQSELIRLLGNWFVDSGRPCSALADGGVVPAFMSAYNMRMPDVVVTCTGYEKEERAISEPVVIAEVLSPSNQADTWSNVWAFTSVPSLREILIVRADRVGADLLRRDAAGAWPAEPLPLGPDAILKLESLGFETPLAALYRTSRFAAAG